MGHRAFRPQGQGSLVTAYLLVWVFQGVSKVEMKPKVLRVSQKRGTKQVNCIAFLAIQY